MVLRVVALVVVVWAVIVGAVFVVADAFLARVDDDLVDPPALRARPSRLDHLHRTAPRVPSVHVVRPRNTRLGVRTR